jgi:hypothetical protein
MPINIRFHRFQAQRRLSLLSMIATDTNENKVISPLKYYQCVIIIAIGQILHPCPCP